MKLRFATDGVRKLVDHAKAASTSKTLYGEETGPGLWIVGDQGVYLMSNGIPHLPNPDKPESNLVIYAEEINPHTLPFDTWWTNKEMSFGGDDGADFLGVKSMEAALEHARGGFIQLNVTQSRISILTKKSPAKRPPKSSRPKNTTPPSGT
jgi:hypothetical protein